MGHFLDRLDPEPPVELVPMERVDELTTGITAKLDELEAARAGKDAPETTVLHGYFIKTVDPRDAEQTIAVAAQLEMSRLDFRTAFVYLIGQGATGLIASLGYYLEHDGQSAIELEHDKHQESLDLQHPDAEQFMVLARTALDGC